MRSYIQNIVLACALLMLSSCATIFNSRMVSFNIVTKQPAHLVIQNDTINSLSEENHVVVNRSKHNLPITVYNDSLTKSVEVKPTPSAVTFLNLYFSYFFFVGLYVDLKTQKGYSYPNTVYIDLADTSSTYFKYRPNPEIYTPYKNILKVTPLKALGLINPAIELSYERKTHKQFSSQLKTGWMLPQRPTEKGKRTHAKGFNASLEEKYFFRGDAPAGFYLAAEISYMSKKYHDRWNFGQLDYDELPYTEQYYDSYDDIYSDTASFYMNYPDTFGIKKQTTSFNIKVGYQHIVKRFVLDFYLGLGIRYRDVRHFDRINPDDQMEGTRHPNAFYITNKEGYDWRVSMPLNIKVGWMF